MSAPALPHQPHPVVLWRELLMPAVFLAFAAYLIFGMLSMEVPDSVDFPGPRFFPTIIAVALVFFALIDIADIFRRNHLYKKHANDAPDVDLMYTAPIMVSASEPTQKIDLKSLAWVVGGFLFFALTLQFLGWVIGAGLLFWCVAKGFGAKHQLSALIVGLTVSSLAYIFFDIILGLNLPSGILGGGF